MTEINCLCVALLCLSFGIGGCPLPEPAPPLGDGTLVFNAESGSPLSADQAPYFTTRSIFEELPGYAGSHAATVAQLPTGELLAAWYSYQGPYELDGSAILMSRSDPNGTAWSTPWVHIDRAEGDGNPVLYAENAQLWLFQAVVPARWSTSRIDFQRSSDGGQSWDTPRTLTSRLGSVTKYPPIRLTDGTLLLPAYSDFIQHSMFFASTDGESWTLRSEIFTNPPVQNSQPAIVQTAAGRIISVMRNSGSWIWTAASDDLGMSWTSPQTSGLPHPSSAVHLIKLANGRLLLVYNDDDTNRQQLTAALSADDGVSWPHQRVIADGESAYSYPTAIQARDGRIHILYTLDRTRIEHVTLNEAWIIAG
jgi:predicted neuraminidase